MQSNSLQSDGPLEDAAKSVALTAAKPFLETKLKDMGVSWETVKAKVKDIPDKVLWQCVHERSVQPLQPYLTLQHLKATKSEAQTNPYCVHIDNKYSLVEKARKWQNAVYATEDGLNAQLTEARKTLAKMQAEQKNAYDKFQVENKKRIAEIEIKQKRIGILQARRDQMANSQPPPPKHN